MEMLLEILEWVNKYSAPNSDYKYSRCVVCSQAWWDEKEVHKLNCWVPRLKQAAEHSLHSDTVESVASTSILQASAESASPV